MANLMPLPKMSFSDSNGRPLVGGKVFFSDAGTSTPKNTYTDATGATPNTNPVVLDARGEASIWLLNGFYKVRLCTQAGVEVWTADNVSNKGDASVIDFKQAGAGAVARTAQDKMRESISPEDYFLAVEADASGMINRAIAAAALVNKGVDLCGNSYIITNIFIKNGLRFLLNGKLTPSTRAGQAAIIFDGGTMGGTAVTRCSISKIEMDCANHPMHCIYGEGVTHCTFEDNNFYNISNVAGVNHGILLLEGSSFNKITNNTITATQYTTSGVLIGLFAAGSDDYYGYFANGTGNITQPVNPNLNNIISENRLYGGQQGIWMHGSNHNVVNNNIIESSRDRGIILVASSNNTVSGNNVSDTKSSGIHMAYGCTQNAITGNKVRQLSSAGGEAGIQAYVGCGGNTIIGNNISTTSDHGINIAVSSNQNTVADNYIQGYAVAGIVVQSDWFGSGGQGVYGRVNYAPPPTGTKWAMGDTFGNNIKSNTISDPANSGADCAIALIQLNSADGSSAFKVLNTSVVGNSVISSALTHNLYIFTQVASGVSLGSLMSNSFSDPTLSKFGGNNTAFGPDGYSYAFNDIEANSGINTMQTFSPTVVGSTAAGTATYTTQFGTYKRVSKEFVEFDLNVTFTGHTGTGGLTIPLPTPVQYNYIGGGWSTMSAMLQSVALTNTKWPAVVSGGGNGDLTFYEYQSAGGVALILMSANGNIYVSGRYRYRNLV